MNGLDLFSGIGGISLGIKEWVRPIAYCEIEPYCQAVLLSRMADGSLSNGPIWDDIRTFEARCLPTGIDIIYGGFPCQNISIAGNGKGLEGERSRLFFEMLRLAKEIKPKFIFLENVPAITTRGGLRVVKEIATLGYDCRWCVISAASVGAMHRRERWFLLCHSNCKPSKQTDKETESNQTERNTWGGSTGFYWPFESREHWRETVSKMGKLFDGLPNQLDRLRALGNSVVPQQVKKAFEILMFGWNK